MMNEQASESQPTCPSNELHFAYPNTCSAFIIVCELLPPAAIALLYFPYLPGGATKWFVIIVALVTLIAAIYRILPARSKGVTLNDKGISTGRRFARWEEIIGVRARTSRRSAIILAVGGGNR